MLKLHFRKQSLNTRSVAHYYHNNRKLSFTQEAGQESFSRTERDGSDDIMWRGRLVRRHFTARWGGPWRGSRGKTVWVGPHGRVPHMLRWWRGDSPEHSRGRWSSHAHGGWTSWGEKVWRSVRAFACKVRVPVVHGWEGTHTRGY